MKRSVPQRPERRIGMRRLVFRSFAESWRWVFAKAIDFDVSCFTLSRFTLFLAPSAGLSLNCEAEWKVRRLVADSQ